ncbi:MAG: hypothetical protein Q9211_000659 [Gyalolechia sp. 1 TL-2023]
MAATQPDLKVLSDSLLVAGRQVSLLPNLPAIDHERYFRDQFARIREGMDEQFRLLRVDLNTRFEQVDKRFEQVDKRLDQVDKRLDQVDKRLDQIDKRLDQVDKRFDQIDKRFEQVDRRFEQVDTRFTDLELSTKSEARNQAARLFNSHVTSVETKLHALYNEQNEAVQGFPEDLAALARLHGRKNPFDVEYQPSTKRTTDNAITALLDAYDLATDGTVATKRRRFRYFIGAVINA